MRPVTSLTALRRLAAGVLLTTLALSPLAAAAQEVEDASPQTTRDEAVERVTVAFAAGDSDGLLDLCAQRVEIILLGQSARYSRGQAAHVLRDFFRRYPPEQVVLSERSTVADGRAAMGRYWSDNSSAPFALYVGFRVGGEAWTLETIRIERAAFQRTGSR